MPLRRRILRAFIFGVKDAIVDLSLSFEHTRVIGALIEKAITTPENYPLSLNSLTAACNQKSNREPVVAMTEGEVQDTLDELQQRHLISQDSGYGSRVVKYRHRFCNTEFGELQLSPQQLGVIVVLFLRGPQTAGELRQRTQRLCDFGSVDEVEQVLAGLAQHEPEALVAQLPREPGKREHRYAHLFSGAVEGAQAFQVAQPGVERAQGLEQRVAALEIAVAQLQERLERLES